VKKLLLFLVLFSAGVGIVTWIDRSRGYVESADPVPEEPAPEEPARPGAARPAESAGEGEGEVEEPPRLVLRGEFSYTKFAEDRAEGDLKLYELEAEDSRAVDDSVVVLEELTAIVYLPDTGEEHLRVRAREARASIRELTDEFRVQLEDAVDLVDVEVTLLRNAPVAPLTLRAPALEGNLETGVFRSDGRVEIESESLEASGTGFRLESDGGLLRFDHHGFARVVLEPQKTASLGAVGPLVVRSSPDGDELVLVAEDGAKLTLLALESVEVDADRIEIRGERDDAEEPRLAIERIVADGSVVLRSGSNRFEGDSATLALGAAGGELDATLRGEPSGLLELGAAAELIGAGSTREAVQVAFSGAGPLTVQRRGDLEFQLAGPAQLAWQDATLDAAQGVAGRLAPDGRSAEFRAREDVRLVRADWSLETSRFDLTHDAERTPPLTARASGPSTLRGREGPEHTFVLDTTERLDFELGRGAWRVPLAEAVELEVVGPDSYTARARQVRDFRAEPLAFRAVDDVAVDSADGTVRGALLWVEGLDRFLMEGREGEPLQFDSPDGSWRARRLERRGDRIVAEQVESARFREEADELELACERLVAERRVEVDETGIERTRQELDATGDVRSTLLYLGDRYRVDCAELLAVRVSNRRDGVFLWSEATLDAVGSVRAEAEHRGTRYDLRSRELEVVRRDRAAEELLSATLTARGDVRFEGEAADVRVEGEGELLTVDKRGRGRLEAEPDGRVRARGRMPGSGHPFDLDAAWLSFSETYLDAADPDVRFDLASRVGAEGELDPSLLHSRATADALACTTDSVELSGNVHVEDHDDDATPWSLDAGEVRFEGRAGKGQPTSALNTLVAWDDVRFRMGTTIEARGDELSARPGQRRVRMTGNVRVLYQGMRLENDWIEYDLLLRALRGGRGRLGPDPEAATRP